MLDVAGEVTASGAFSAAEMRAAAIGADAALACKSPPSTFADPVSVPGSPDRTDSGRPSPARSGARGALVSEEARRRFQQAAATSAHARAFAAPPRPHLSQKSAGAIAETDARRRAVMGAGRAVPPPPEGPPAMVKSTTRFL